MVKPQSLGVRELAGRGWGEECLYPFLRDKTKTFSFRVPFKNGTISSQGQTMQSAPARSGASTRLRGLGSNFPGLDVQAPAPEERREGHCYTGH